jgi:hypothetical protein
VLVEQTAWRDMGIYFGAPSPTEIDAPFEGQVIGGL